MDFPDQPVKPRHWMRRVLLSVVAIGVGLGLYAGLSFGGTVAEANQSTSTSETKVVAPAGLFNGTDLVPNADFRVSTYAANEDTTSINLIGDKEEVRLVFSIDKACKESKVGCDYDLKASEFKANDENGWTVSVPGGSIQVNGLKSAAAAADFAKTLKQVSPETLTAALATVQ